MYGRFCRANATTATMRPMARSCSVETFKTPSQAIKACMHCKGEVREDTRDAAAQGHRRQDHTQGKDRARTQTEVHGKGYLDGGVEARAHKSNNSGVLWYVSVGGRGPNTKDIITYADIARELILLWIGKTLSEAPRKKGG